MPTSKDIFDKIQKMYTDNPQRLNIIEEQIDLDIQMNYFKRSGMLKKQVVKLDDVLAKYPMLYDPDVRLEEKRDILIYLASFEDVETFRLIEKFKNEATGEIKFWAIMAYRESKMLIESSLLEDDSPILISTGLGGKGNSLRYFVCLVHKNGEYFNEFQDRIIRNEFYSSAEKNGAEIESLIIENQYVKVYMLVPINKPIQNVVGEVVDASVELGNFLDEHTIITNVRAFSDEEIDEIVQGKLQEDDVLGLDEMEGIPFIEAEDSDIDLEDGDEDGEDENDDDIF